MRRRLLPLLLLAALFGTNPAWAEPFRILYAEQIDLPLAIAPTPSGAAVRKLQPQQLALRAYGREYDLRLEPNDSLAGRLPAAVRDGKALYRGSLEGLAGSWVRLTVVAGEVFGAFWDGTDLYSIAPASAVEPFLDAPLPEAARTGTFVYRLSDTVGGVEHNFCGMSSEVASRGAALNQYRALMAELKSIAASSALPLQIEVALVGDPELAARFPDPQGQMLAVVNIVDGIFTNQIGVSILPTDVRMLDGASNPLQSTDAPTLLDELSDYRVVTPAVRERGLAHLLTGKELDGSVAGIAFLGALCEPAAGVGLSEGWHGSSLSALIMAHELGHNFGAPHDAEPGSPCAGTPGGFLMAPVVNFSNTFSNCSRQQMQPQIAAAACVVPLRIADVMSEVPATVQGLIHEPLDIPVEVRSIGALTAQDVTVRIIAGNMLLDGFTASAGTCSIAGAAVNCQFGAIPAGETRLVTVHVTPGPSPGIVIVEASSPNDRNAANNNATGQVVATTPADVLVGSPPFNVGGRVGAPISFSVGLNTTGPRAARNATAQIVVDNTQILSATPTSGSCAITGVVVNCTFGDLPSGSSRRIDVTVQASQVAGQGVSFHVAADNDFNTANNDFQFPIALQAVSDLGLRMASSGGDFVIDAPFDIVMVLRSTGLEASAPGTVTLSARTERVPTFDSVVAPGGTCTLGNDTIVCTYDSLAAGAERTITVRAHAPAGFYELQARVESTVDDTPGNNQAGFQASVRPAIDVSVGTVSGGSMLPFLEVPFQGLAVVRSVGVLTANDVSVRTEIPPQFQITSATLQGGSCNVVAQVVTCNRAALPVNVDARLEVGLVATQLGTFQVDVVVSAPGDPGNSFDDTLTWFIETREGPDTAIDPPAPATILVGLSQPLPIVVRNGRLPASPRVTMTVPSHVLVDSASVPGGRCLTQGPSSITCFIDAMAPREVLQIELRVRAQFMANFAVSVQLATFGFDVNPANDTGSLAVTVTDRQGDAGVQVTAATASGRVGETFAFPIVTVTATTPIDDARVFLTVNTNVVFIGAVTADSGACSVTGVTIICLLGTIEPATARRVALTLQGRAAGSFVGTVQLVARNDTNFGNDTAQVAFDVSAPPPPPPPANSGGGGGGGGGAMEPYSILALLAFVGLALSDRRFRRGRLLRPTRA